MTRDGALLVDKAPGLTSHDVVDLFRRRTRSRKVGHTGTLDPFATGLLILCVDRATRLQSFLMGLEKTYEGWIQFGWATDTYDSAGKAVGEALSRGLTGIDLESAKERFVGELEQTPPAYSAKKIGGVRAYELARRGETPVIEPKRVHVFEFSILAVEGSRAAFRIRCSAGTYVRSIAHELGAAVGIPAHLDALRRTAIGSFPVADAIASQRIPEASLEELLAAPHFHPLDRLPLPFSDVRLDPTQEKRFLSGQSVVAVPAGAGGVRLDDLLSVINLRDELLAIGVVTDVVREGGGPVTVQPKIVLRR
jgi:tRNA pseudouridine55 synthase